MFRIDRNWTSRGGLEIGVPVTLAVIAAILLMPWQGLAVIGLAMTAIFLYIYFDLDSPPPHAPYKPPLGAPAPEKPGAILSPDALERIRDWRQRHNPELVRIARDYAAERRAAGRSIPADVELIAHPEGT